MFYCGFMWFLSRETYLCLKKFAAGVTGWMLNLAADQTRDALCTNESTHFNNPIWHRGPASTPHPSWGSHSCFNTVVRYKLPGPRINWFDSIWPCDKGRLSAHSYFKEYFETRSRISAELNAQSPFGLTVEMCAWRMLHISGRIYLLSSFEP